MRLILHRRRPVERKPGNESKGERRIVGRARTAQVQRLNDSLLGKLDKSAARCARDDAVQPRVSISIVGELTAGHTFRRMRQQIHDMNVGGSRKADAVFRSIVVKREFALCNELKYYRRCEGLG